jgi:hypothetical protein
VGYARRRAALPARQLTRAGGGGGGGAGGAEERRSGVHVKCGSVGLCVTKEKERERRASGMCLQQTADAHSQVGASACEQETLPAPYVFPHKYAH